MTTNHAAAPPTWPGASSRAARRIAPGSPALVSETFAAVDPAGRVASYEDGGIGEHRAWDVAARKTTNPPRE